MTSTSRRTLLTATMAVAALGLAAATGAQPPSTSPAPSTLAAGQSSPQVVASQSVQLTAAHLTLTDKPKKKSHKKDKKKEKKSDNDRSG